MSQAGDHRPRTTAEKMRFASRGRMRFIVLRGGWGRTVDKAFVWATGYSLITKQYALAGRRPYQPTLMLTTIGARSRRLRRSVLPYFEVDGALVVRGSNGGGPTDPHWVHNVRADAHAWVRIGWTTRPAHAHVARGVERERLFAELCQRSPATATYQEMCAPRELPLVVLRDWASLSSS